MMEKDWALDGSWRKSHYVVPMEKHGSSFAGTAIHSYLCVVVMIIFCVVDVGLTRAKMMEKSVVIWLLLMTMASLVHHWFVTLSTFILPVKHI
jgi:hypothetical protein